MHSRLAFLCIASLLGSCCPKGPVPQPVTKAPEGVYVLDRFLPPELGTDEVVVTIADGLVTFEYQTEEGPQRVVYEMGEHIEYDYPYDD